MRALAAALILLANPAAAVALPPSPAEVSACFTPAESCVGAIVDAINGARTSIRVQAYGFSSLPILGALTAAKRRGVDVQAVLDKSDDRTGLYASYSGATYIAHAGIPVWIDYRPAIAHNKVIVIDGELVVTGSYNFTKAAELRNAENVLFVRSADIAAQFEANWESRRLAARPYELPE